MLYLIQNDAAVPPGLYADHLRCREIPCQLVRLDLGDPLPNPSRLRGAIVLGGYMSVDDVEDYPFLQPLQEWMRRLTELGRPLLGICLGGQLLARALGGPVHRDQRGERGILSIQVHADAVDDPLLQCMPASFSSLQWHNDSFDPPPGATLLASSAACVGQLFRAGPGSYGLQFHPEADAGIIRSWSARTAAESAILDHYQQQEEEIRSASLTLLDNFLKICGY